MNDEYNNMLVMHWEIGLFKRPLIHIFNSDQAHIGVMKRLQDIDCIVNENKIIQYLL